MKTQGTAHSMRQYFIILVSLILIILLGITSGGMAASAASRGRWKKKASMPTARYGLSTSEVNGKIYAIGGWPGHLSAVEEYNPKTNTWTKKSDMTRGVLWFPTSVVNGKIYAIGGEVVPVFRGGPTRPTVDEYNPVTDKWTLKTNMPTPRAHLSTSVVNGKIYAIGGFRLGVALSAVEEYDPVTDKWTKKANMPTPRADLSTSVVNGKIYAIGGATWNRGFWKRSLSIVEEYDPATNKWTRKNNMPTPRWVLSTSAVNGKIYAIGGATELHLKPLSTVEEYTPQGWLVDPQGKLATTWGEVKRRK